MVELQQLRCLVAVLDTGSFTKAAATLHVTQGAVSHAVNGLERELGVGLVRRGRGGASATDAGARVAEHARAVLARLRAAEDEVLAMRGLRAGRLRVGSFTSASTRLLPGLLAAYRRQHPDVEVTLREGNDLQTRDLLADGEVDVAFVVLPADGHDVIALAEDELVLVVPESHRLARHRVVPLAELVPEPLIVSSGGCATLVQSTFREHGLEPWESGAVQEGSTALAMVEGGLGVTLMPELAVPPLPGTLVTRPVRPTGHRRLGLAARSQEAHSPALQAFLALAKQQAPELARRTA
ncbi:LysR substrate-binding domain-containing protein [Saccharopolyspora shandongensis]|uniref:LysR family transcriptional regulator n=1 Tax=Saccharopolyspora shandongensis TaxID=418495 RepID=UPI0034142F4C